VNIKYLLHKSRVQEVANLLFPHGRKVDWEMQAVNGHTEELSLTTNDLDLHEAVLAICTFTKDKQRSRIQAAINAREKRLRDEAKRKALLSKIRAREQYFERGVPVR